LSKNQTSAKAKNNIAIDELKRKARNQPKKEEHHKKQQLSLIGEN